VVLPFLQVCMATLPQYPVIFPCITTVLNSVFSAFPTEMSGNSSLAGGGLLGCSLRDVTLGEDYHAGQAGRISRAVAMRWCAPQDDR
jgi:hypothetical protein